MPFAVPRPALRAAVALGACAGALLLTAVPALAHVTAQPGEAEQSGYTVVAMRVPNESETAGTIKLEVTLPLDHPITGVRTTPVAGWTITTTKAPLNPPLQRNGRTYAEVVRTVTWTADSGVRIGPGEFQEFPLSLGPLPGDVDQILLPSVQTYDDGEIVRWEQPPVPGGAEPERPSPVLKLLPAAPEGAGASPPAAPAAAPGPAVAPAAASDTTARWLGGGGLLLGAVGLLLGLRARSRGGAA